MQKKAVSVIGVKEVRQKGQKVQDTLEESLGAIEGASGYTEVQWNNIKESVLDTVSDLVGMVKWRAKKPWITQEMISKTDDGRK
jgi:hypothetical protein